MPPEIIGRLLITGFGGAGASDSGAQHLARHIAAGRLGGVCFLAANTLTRDGVLGLTRLFNDASNRVLITATDQEGGMVQRLSSKLGFGFEPSARQMATSEDPAHAENSYASMASAMRQSGFNLNLAPVVDLGVEPRNPLIAGVGRAFGSDVGTVVNYARAFVAGHRRERVLTALKHFPGHGSTMLDSHLTTVDLSQTWHTDELEPYRCLSLEGYADIVMSGHLKHPLITLDEPATLSRRALTDILRTEIGFTGLAITDDLDMGAIRHSLSQEEAAVRALAAGNDLLLYSNITADPDLPMRLVVAIQIAVLEGRLDSRQIEASADKVDKLLGGLSVGPPWHVGPDWTRPPLPHTPLNARAAG
jgi:beta-N-acetylhexosaminidase